MVRVRNARARLAVQRLEPHHPHQPAHPVPAHRRAFTAKMTNHLPAPVERMLQIQLVEPTHQRHVFVARPAGRVVQRRATQAKQLALTPKAQPTPAFDHRQALLATQLPNPAMLTDSPLARASVMALSTAATAAAASSFETEVLPATWDCDVRLPHLRVLPSHVSHRPGHDGPFTASYGGPGQPFPADVHPTRGPGLESAFRPAEALPDDAAFNPRTGPGE